LIVTIYAVRDSCVAFSFYCDGLHRDLHSFPTRRSSDLGARGAGRLGDVGGAGDAAAFLAGGRGGSVHLHPRRGPARALALRRGGDRKSTRLNSSHVSISYAVFCLKKKKTTNIHTALT